MSETQIDSRDDPKGEAGETIKDHKSLHPVCKSIDSSDLLIEVA